MHAYICHVCYLRIVAIGRLVGEDVKVRSLANGRMEVGHLDDGSNDSSVTQNLQNRIPIFLRVANGILPILDHRQKRVMINRWWWWWRKMNDAIDEIAIPCMEGIEYVTLFLPCIR